MRRKKRAIIPMRHHGDYLTENRDNEPTRSAELLLLLWEGRKPKNSGVAADHT